MDNKEKEIGRQPGESDASFALKLFSLAQVTKDRAMYIRLKKMLDAHFDKCKDGVDASGNNNLVFHDSSIIQVIQGVEYDDDGTPETVIKLKVMENESEQRGSPK